MDAAPTMLAAVVAVLAGVVALLPMLRRRLSGVAPADKRTDPFPLPPGSIGPPIVGHTLSFVRALRANTAEEWLRRRVAMYGPVSRLSLFRCPTAFVVGAAANKFLFGSADLAPKTTESLSRMIGRRSIRHVVGDEHRRVRAMVVQFLRLDAEVRRHLDAEWCGRSTVSVMPSMKSLTFDIMCTVIFRLDRGEDAAVRRELSAEFQQLASGVTALPVNLPFTTFGKCLAASRRGRGAVTGVIQERRARLERGESSPADDVITHMLAEGLPDHEEHHRQRHVPHDRGARHHRRPPHLPPPAPRRQRGRLRQSCPEQEDVARGKAPGEALSWEDLGRMRYTWAAAMETLRMVPPVFNTVRRALRDVEFGGYLIPRGWQVLHAASMTHLDPAIFPEPGRFDPARFESSSPAAAAAATTTIPPFSFVPFGGGVRVCPGNEFARVETLVAVHYIVTRFKWKLAAGCDGSFSRFPLPYPSQGLLIDIQPRQRLEMNA
ncbi:hypothetical protein ACP4OV_031800 [Aristida adscensionis]